MVFRPFSIVVAATLTAIAASGCGGGGGGGGTPPTASSSTPPPIVMDHSVPTGDTFNTVGTSWDITDVKTTLYGDTNQVNTNAYDSLRVDVTFAQNIANALPPPGSALSSGSQLAIQVAIQPNPSATLFTTPFNCVVQGTAFSFGSNGASRLSDGNYPVIDGSGQPINQPGNVTTESQTSVSGNVISQIFRLGPLGVAETTTAPQLAVAVFAFNGDATTSSINSGSEETDCAPRGTEAYAAN